MICPKCGKNCADGSNFCDGCGTSLTAQQPNQQTNQQANQQPKQQAGQQQNYYYNNQNNNQQNGYQQPPYQQNGYQQPPYQQNGYQQPPYQQNSYQQNGNQQNGYQQNPYQPNGPQYGNYRAPVKNRNIALCVVLSIITCGIYGIYWLVCLVDDLNVASGRTGDTSGGMVFLLSLITCGIYGIYWMYIAGEKVAYIKQRNTGEIDSSSSVLYLILGIIGFGIVAYALIQSELNKVATLQ